MLGYPVISSDELAQAKNNAMLTLAGMAINVAMSKIYSTKRSMCKDPKDHERMICLFLYMYVADSWCEDECDCNYITEQQFLAVITRIEELQQACCDFRVDGEVDFVAPDTSDPIREYSNEFN